MKKKAMRKRIKELERELHLANASYELCKKELEDIRSGIDRLLRIEPVEFEFTPAPDDHSGDTIESVLWDIEEENMILKAKLAYCHDRWSGVTPLSKLLSETREEFRAEYIRKTGIENPDISGWKFLEDYLPKGTP